MKNTINTIDKLMVHIAQSFQYMKKCPFEETIGWKMAKGKLNEKEKKIVQQAIVFLKRQPLYLPKFSKNGKPHLYLKKGKEIWENIKEEMEVVYTLLYLGVEHQSKCMRYEK